jgi:hypothetical protein
MKLIPGRPNAIDLLIRTEDHRATPPDPPRAGLRPQDVVCHLKSAGSFGWTRKELSPASWQDSGRGTYVLTLDPDDLEHTHVISVLITGAPGLRSPVIPVERTFEVGKLPSYDDTCEVVEKGRPCDEDEDEVLETILRGRVITLAKAGKPKAQVIARLAQCPQTVSGAVLANDTITVETDDHGSFELKVATGANIQLQVPAAQYTRNLIVPPPRKRGEPVELFPL